MIEHITRVIHNVNHLCDPIKYYDGNMNTLGERLAYARKARGVTQKDLAKRAGVVQSAIANTEGRQAQTSLYTVQIAYALKINPLWLATGQGEMDLPHLTEDETHLLHDYRDNPEINKDAIRTIARSGRSTKNPENSTNLLTEQKIA